MDEHTAPQAARAVGLSGVLSLPFPPAGTRVWLQPKAPQQRLP